MNGIKAVVCGMIFMIALELIYKEIFKTVNEELFFDYKALIIISVLGILKLIFKKKVTPIMLIGISAVLGLIAYGVF